MGRPDFEDSVAGENDEYTGIDISAVDYLQFGAMPIDMVTRDAQNDTLIAKLQESKHSEQTEE